MVQEHLLSTIQVLVFVDEYMIESRAVGRSWIVSDEAQCQRNKLSNKHSLVESKPRFENGEEQLILWAGRPTGHVGLQPCPRCGKRVEAFPEASDPLTVGSAQIFEEEALLESENRPRYATGHREYFSSGKQAKAESVDSPAPDTVSSRNSEECKFTLEIACGGTCERADK
jgi:hypothetical protein